MRPEIAGFERESHAYERGRPGYPPDAVRFVVESVLRPGGVPSNAPVVDLAAGTGKLTRELVSRGIDVIAIEPLDEMRTRLVEAVPGVDARSGTAHETGLESALASAVTIAQAFHWFSDEAALAEIARILVPLGRLVLVWNRRDLSDPVQAEISRLTAPFVGEVPSYTTGRWEEVMAATRRFSPVGDAHFEMSQHVDRRTIADRVGSTSYIATLEPVTRGRLLEEVSQLVPDGRTLSLAYTTDVYVYERAPVAP